CSLFGTVAAVPSRICPLASRHHRRRCCGVVVVQQGQLQIAAAATFLSVEYDISSEYRHAQEGLVGQVVYWTALLLLPAVPAVGDWSRGVVVVQLMAWIAAVVVVVASTARFEMLWVLR
ncbi:unnamed protein product, partial [Ectocarpus sp. 12 AP-2014]